MWRRTEQGELLEEEASSTRLEPGGMLGREGELEAAGRGHVASHALVSLDMWAE